MVNLSNLYLKLIQSPNFEEDGYRLTQKNLIFEEIESGFERIPDIERRFHISFDKKVEYIKKNYFLNFQFEKNVNSFGKKCITGFNIIGDTLYVNFRSSRLFPTLYADLYTIHLFCKEKHIKKVCLHFENLWIGAHIVLIKNYQQSWNWVKKTNYWETKFNSEKKLPVFLQKVKSKYIEVNQWHT